MLPLCHLNLSNQAADLLRVGCGVILDQAVAIS